LRKAPSSDGDAASETSELGDRNLRRVATTLSVASQGTAHEYRRQAEFLKIITSPKSELDVYAEAVIAEVTAKLEADRCSVYFVNEVRKEVWCVGILDADSFNMPWEKGVVGVAARQGILVNLEDAHSHSAFDRTMEDRTGYKVKGMLCLPIKHMIDESRTIGVLQVLNKHGGPDARFSKADEEDLDKIARLISDSFFRHRWKAMESWPSRGDQEAMSLRAETRPRRGSIPAIANADVAIPIAPSKFQWPDAASDSYLDTTANLRSLEFSALEHSQEELVGLVQLVMEHVGCIELYSIQKHQFQNWVASAKKMYRNNPFHNFLHGFSVFQMCYYQLFTTGIHKIFTPLDVFGLMVAALCHDIDHPGVTNAFMVDSQSELAVRYNEHAVLENHHAAVTCGLLRNDETAIISALGRPSQAAIRRVIIKCILDTDMAHHNEMCKSLLAVMAFSEEDRPLMLSACIHSSDLSAQVLPWNTAAQWEERISQEFANQAAQEVKDGRVPLPFMDFRMDDTKQRGKLQRGFIDFVLVPLWDPYTLVLQELRRCKDNLIQNRALYDYRANHGCDENPQFAAVTSTVVFP
jgi:hypothetical protein